VYIVHLNLRFLGDDQNSFDFYEKTFTDLENEIEKKLSLRIEYYKNAIVTTNVLYVDKITGKPEILNGGGHWVHPIHELPPQSVKDIYNSISQMSDWYMPPNLPDCEHMDVGAHLDSILSSIR